MSEYVNRIKMLKKYSNIDELYGPYNSTMEACAAIPESLRDKGLTVGIIEDGSIVEYWWKKDISDSDLKPKIEDYFLEILTFLVIPHEERNTISFNYKVNGRGFRTLVSVYLSGKLIYTKFLLGFGEFIEDFEEFPGPKDAGEYIYTCIVTDSVFGNSDNKTGNLSWKDIDVRIINPFNIPILSLNNIQAIQNPKVTVVVNTSNKVSNLKVYKIFNSNSPLEITSLDGITYEEVVDTANLNKGNSLKIQVTGNVAKENGISESKFLEFPIFNILTENYLDFQIFRLLNEKIYKGRSFKIGYYYESENKEFKEFIVKWGSNVSDSKNISILSYYNGSFLLTIDTIGMHNIIIYKKEDLVLPLKTIPVNVLNISTDVSNTEYTSPDNINLTLRDMYSYIVEMKCTIPYSADLTAKLFEFLDISIYPQYILFGGLRYPTFLGLEVTFGFLYHVEESNHIFNAITVNGCICSKEVIAERLLIPSIQSANINNIKIDTFRLYVNPENPIDILENNYKTDNIENNDLPEVTPNVFKITVLNNVTLPDTKYVAGLFGTPGEGKYTFGTDSVNINLLLNIPAEPSNAEIKTAMKKAMKSSSENHEQVINYLKAHAELLKLDVGFKNYLQKYIAVPVEILYNGITYYALVFTQGTSTLKYLIPNFTFKFFSDNTFTTSSSVQFIPKIIRNINSTKNGITESNNDYYAADELVAKIDYMEESHLNNTPTAMFYNMLTLNGGIAQLHLEDGINAIEGIPITLEIENINYGSFMLNLPKTSSYIYFGSEGISLEATSNSASEGFSGAFLFNSGSGTLEDPGNQLDINAQAAFSSINPDNITAIDTTIADFLNEGLEYRYSSNPDVDVIGDDLDDYKRIVKMWKWVYDTEIYTKDQFNQVFNFDSCALYFIQMMVFGQTDNLRKNMMLDLFTSNGLWFVRPYDMDSLAGLNNKGQDIFPPYIEINRAFTLDGYSSSQSFVSYLGTNVDRFPFTANNSNLWFRFYTNLKLEIRQFYTRLRQNGYSAETVIDLCKKTVISKLDISQYNEDFRVKYLVNELPDLQFVTGNRWLKFLDWIKRRFDFCDVYFMYTNNPPLYPQYSVTNSSWEYTPNIKYEMPLYTITKYGDTGTGALCYYGDLKSTTPNITSLGIGYLSGILMDIWISTKYILEAPYLFTAALLSFTPKARLDYLVEFDGTYENLYSIDLSNNNIILNITVSGNITDNNLNLHVPLKVEKLIIQDSLSPNYEIILHDYSGLKELSISNSLFYKLELENCNSLEKISILDSSIPHLIIKSCGEEEHKIDIINGNSTFLYIQIDNSNIQCLDLSNLTLLEINFSGDNSNIDILCLYQAVISLKELNIEFLTCKHLLLNNCGDLKVIFSSSKHFSTLGLENSLISQFGSNRNYFDGKCITNLTRTVRITDNNKDTIITNLKNGGSSNLLFKFQNCSKIKNIADLDYSAKIINEYSTSFFSGCTDLVSIENCTLTLSPTEAFAYCSNLSDISGSLFTFSGNNKDATRMFIECLKLNWTQISTIIGNLTPTNGREMFYKKGWPSNATINLSFLSLATDLMRCFSLINWSDSSLPATQNLADDEHPITLTFTGKLTKVTNAEAMFAGLGNRGTTSNINNGHYIYIVPSDVFEDSAELTNANYCFSHLKRYFTVPYIPSLVENIRGICMSCLNLNLPTEWKIPKKARNCASAFYNTTFSTSDREISLLFDLCTLVEDLTNCFRDCKNCACSNVINFASQNSSTNVNIGGIFANAKHTTSERITVPFGFNFDWKSSIADYKIGADATYASSNSQVGPYYNTLVNISQSELTFEKDILGLFDGATINRNDLTLNITSGDCYRICRNTGLSSALLSVTLNRVVKAVDAFRGCSKLSTVTLIDSKDTLENATSMFLHSNITKVLPDLCDYSKLETADYMYACCDNLSGTLNSIGNGRDYLLPFASLTSIKGMFAGCININGGIPSNLIGKDQGNQNYVTDISELFAATNILSNSSSGSIDFSLLFPLAVTADGVFLYSDNNGGSQTISSSCFSKCKQCRNLFAGSNISLTANMNFQLAVYLLGAFACGRTFTSYPTLNLNNFLFSTTADIKGLCMTKNVKNPNIQENIEGILAHLQTIDDRLGALSGYSVPSGVATDIAFNSYSLLSITVNPLENKSPAQIRSSYY